MKRLALCGLFGMALLAGCGPSADELRERGITDFQVGKMAQAQENFDKVLSRHPGDSVAMYYVGRIKHAEGKVGEAVFWYQSAIDADPSNTEARRWWARAKEELGATGEDSHLPRKG